MDWALLIGTFAIVTLLAGVAIALNSKKNTEVGIYDRSASKSTLARDGDPHGKPADA